MSEVLKTNMEVSFMNCNNGNYWWIIILVLLFCGCGNNGGCGCGNNGIAFSNNGCGGGCGCDNGCGCN